MCHILYLLDSPCSLHPCSFVYIPWQPPFWDILKFLFSTKNYHGKNNPISWCGKWWVCYPGGSWLWGKTVVWKNFKSGNFRKSSKHTESLLASWLLTLDHITPQSTGQLSILSRVQIILEAETWHIGLFLGSIRVLLRLSANPQPRKTSEGCANVQGKPAAQYPTLGHYQDLFFPAIHTISSPHPANFLQCPWQVTVTSPPSCNAPSFSRSQRQRALMFARKLAPGSRPEGSRVC